MHGQGLVHCDIKPNNIFIREATPLNIVIGDLGLATTMDDLRTGCGTEKFMAPEFFLVYFAAKLTPAIDVYALGRTFHVMLEYDRVEKEGFKPRSKEYSPPHYPRLVQKMTEEKPTDRPMLQQVQRLLDERKDFSAPSPVPGIVLRESNPRLPPVTGTTPPASPPSYELATSLAPHTALIARRAQPVRIYMGKKPEYPRIAPQNVIRLCPPMRQARRHMADIARGLSPVPEESIQVRSEKKVDFTKPTLEPDNIFGGHDLERNSNKPKVPGSWASTQSSVKSCMKSNPKSDRLSMREAGQFPICDSIRLHNVRRQGGKVLRKPMRKHKSIWRNLKFIAEGVADLAIDVADIGQDVFSWTQRSLASGTAAVAVPEKITWPALGPS